MANTSLDCSGIVLHTLETPLKLLARCLLRFKEVVEPFENLLHGIDVFIHTVTEPVDVRFARTFVHCSKVSPDKERAKDPFRITIKRFLRRSIPRQVAVRWVVQGFLYRGAPKLNNIILKLIIADFKRFASLVQHVDPVQKLLDTFVDDHFMRRARVGVLRCLSACISEVEERAYLDSEIMDPGADGTIGTLLFTRRV